MSSTGLRPRATGMAAGGVKRRPSAHADPGGATSPKSTARMSVGAAADTDPATEASADCDDRPPLEAANTAAARPKPASASHEARDRELLRTTGEIYPIEYVDVVAELQLIVAIRGADQHEPGDDREQCHEKQHADQ